MNSFKCSFEGWCAMMCAEKIETDYAIINEPVVMH